mmetsp:Transcript_10168/g.30588  ORF Transcript_10168/g.30588 Transcript_10168/m.30588 type:complete len:1078 (-) Transcript_10168:186-3419(-)
MRRARVPPRRSSAPSTAPDAAVADEDRYRGTVLLPETPFPQRAGAAKTEPKIQKFWEETGTYEALWDAATGPAFTLHDGPPYANGDLHIGHALNKVLKDVINRSRMLRGDKVRYVPGWDCHGLPIELKVLQAINDENKKIKKKTGEAPPPLSPLELRKRAAGFAEETVAKQRDSFRRYGVWADWDAPYLTLQPEYEAAQLRVFAKMFERGAIYRGLKPVWYSPSSRTALAEAELEYPDGHTSPSVYAALDVTAPSPALSGITDGNVQLAVWTTTPWTLPANLAVAVNGDLTYAVVEGGGRTLVVAEALVESLGEKFGHGLSVKGTLKGEALAGTAYKRPVANAALGGDAKVVVGGDYITSEGGTGLVHTAPGHGQDDYQTGLKHDLPPFSPVDGAGKFTADAGENLEGLPVLSKGSDEIAERLEASGHLLLKEPYGHRYPYDWRTKKPVLMRATDQWFASVDSFRDDALKAIDKVTWMPEVGRNRILGMTEQRGDWCISRQRNWGVPLPVFYDKDTGEPLVTSETLQRVVDIVEAKGTDAWFELEASDILGDLVENPDQYVKGTDTMDVWFDSGTSWAGVVGARPELGKPDGAPADLYLEGSDQHRGWFQSSLLTSVACRGGDDAKAGGAPYEAVLTHGFVLDEKGFKMSKSLGNVVDPRMIIEGGNNLKKDPAYGADVLRLWVASVDYASDVRIGPNTIKQVFEQYRKLRNTLRYLAGNVNDVPVRDGSAEWTAKYDATDPDRYASLASLDKWLLGRLGELEKECYDAYDSFQFQRAVNALGAFAANELSALYLDVAKDRLYVSSRDAGRRVACQSVLVACLDVLPKLMAPVLPHLAEELYQSLPHVPGTGMTAERGSVFGGAPWKRGALADFPAHDEAAWAARRALRDDANAAIEKLRRDKVVGASLDAAVYAAPPTDPEAKAAFDLALSGLSQAETFAPHGSECDAVDDARFLFLVSDVKIVADADAVAAACAPDHVVASVDSATGATVGAAAAVAPPPPSALGFRPRFGLSGSSKRCARRPSAPPCFAKGTVVGAAPVAASRRHGCNRAAAWTSKRTWSRPIAPSTSFDVGTA